MKRRKKEKKKQLLWLLILGFIVGYSFQFIRYGFNDIWYFFPLKFTSLMGLMVGYLYHVFDSDDFYTRSGYVRLSLIFVAIPVFMAFYAISANFNIPWILGI